MTLDDKKVLVFGTGISGIAAVGLLQNTKADIVLYDSSSVLSKKAIIDKLPNDFSGEIILGELSDNIIEEIDLLVLSPGVPTDHDVVNKMRDLHIPIWGEVELAYKFEKGRVIAITGTNGKTTTTALLGEILRKHFKKVFIVGNIGIPYTGLVLETTPESITAAEISSFQLETIHKFRPNVSAILNISPDHLDRHYNMKDYANIKAKITQNQLEEDICILNYDDKVLRKLEEGFKAKTFYFSSTTKLDDGIYLDNNNIIYSRSSHKEVVCDIHDLKIFGIHNYENVMVAIGLSLAIGVPMDDIRMAVKDFKGVEHRIEYVTKKNGVTYYNDSKGTNTEASIKAIESMHTPTVLIAGGYDKGSDYEDWIKSFGDKIKYLVLLGQTKEKIAKTARDNGFTNIIIVDTLEEAVKASADNANEGESVLLSPACASWGMFRSYEERGNLFKDYVEKLQ